MRMSDIMSECDFLRVPFGGRFPIEILRGDAYWMELLTCKHRAELSLRVL